MAEVFVSTIIATIGRPTLERAVKSVLAQEFDRDGEVIVVNDSGLDLPDAEWQRSPRVRVITTERLERCVARNTGAAIACGAYLHFLDDDDWLLPGAFARLAQLAAGTPASWLCGGTQLVDRMDQPSIQLRPELPSNCSAMALSGEWIPLQSSLIAAELFDSVGGFDQQAIWAEDIDLVRRLSLRSAIACTPGAVACVSIGAGGTTTDYRKGRMNLRAAREPLLDNPGTLSRLWESADSPYWHGRIARIYFTSAFWNIQNGRPSRAGNRAIKGVSVTLRSGRCLFAPAFWQALLKNYHNETFEKGLSEAVLYTHT